ncbi:MAG: hypothetical protein LBH32_14985 [Dysgonamonadaceae bacterium]|jgi:hypothetical protein|nr:hypothetical protein [Dysgonamonadaceae bacterium]
MNDKSVKIENIGKTNPFKTPEGYFDNLTESIMSNLPDKFESKPKILSFWDRMQPWLYMAAMFFGIALMLEIVSPRKTLNLTSSTEVEEFYQYYEEQLTSNLYHESLYPDESNFSEHYE